MIKNVINITLLHSTDLNTLIDSGIYVIKGNANINNNLPNSIPTGEYINAELTVLNSSINSKNVKITQYIKTSDDSFNIYKRQGKGTLDNIIYTNWEGASSNGGTANIEAEAPLSQKDGKLTLNIGDGLKVENNKLVATPQSSSDTSNALRALFIAAGAEYNDTGADIIKTTPWAAFVDDIEYKAQNNIDVLNYTTADLLSIVQDGTTYNYVIDNGVYKVVARASRGQLVHDESFCVHRAGCYYLNGLGDITEEQMLAIFNHGNTLAIKYFLNTYKSRTNRMLTSIPTTTELDGYYYARDCESEVVTLDKGEYSIVNMRTSDNVFGNMFKLTHLLGRFRFESAVSNGFYNCKLLKTVKIHQLKYNISLSDCPLISKNSILYAIRQSAATTEITITLHANAYARLKDNPDVVAALRAKPLVTLVSA